MRTGSRGLALIRQFEGLRLHAYRDAVGVLTIGYGLTNAAGVIRVTPGMTITKTQAEHYLIQALGKYEVAVASALQRDPSQNQFDAMVSLCFNIGAGKFAGSRLVKLFNAGDDGRAADAFLAWRKAGGRVLPGLSRRRAAERRLFLSQTSRGKWAVAGTSGAIGGGLAAKFGEAAVDSLGYSFGNLMSFELLGIIAVVTGVVAVAALAFLGDERRERLWNRLFGGWLS
jgi:lysozyme